MFPLGTEECDGVATADAVAAVAQTIRMISGYIMCINDYTVLDVNL